MGGWLRSGSGPAGEPSCSSPWCPDCPGTSSYSCKLTLTSVATTVPSSNVLRPPQKQRLGSWTSGDVKRSPSGPPERRPPLRRRPGRGRECQRTRAPAPPSPAHQPHGRLPPPASSLRTPDPGSPLSPPLRTPDPGSPLSAHLSLLPQLQGHSDKLGHFQTGPCETGCHFGPPLQAPSSEKAGIEVLLLATRGSTGVCERVRACVCACERRRRRRV